MTKSLSGSSKGSHGELNPVPTTVGIVNHDPTRPRAPGFSFGCRFSEKARPTPGPQYMVESGLTPRGQEHGPSFSIRGRPTRSLWLTGSSGNSPGPSAYNVASNFALRERRGPSYSIGAPYCSDHRRAGPAPNAYQLPSTLGMHVNTVRAAPAAAIHGKGSANKGFAYDNSKTPGPAAYGATDPYLTERRAPAVTIKSRTKEPAVKLITPGPGAYDPGNGSNVSKSGTRFSFGVRHGQQVRPYYTLADVSD